MSKICGASTTNTCALAAGHVGWCSYDTPYVTIRELRAENEALKAELNIVGSTRDELRAESERLRLAMEKHHDLLSDEPGDLCKTCGLAWE